ncbi:MCE family protein [Williamsia sterculiae]
MANSQTNSGPGKWFTARHVVVIVIALVLALIVAVALWWVFNAAGKTKITAYFERGIGIYKGSDVRILGLPAGNVDSVTPQGDRVKVTMSVDSDIKLPRDVRAVQITPSIVADRFIQLTPTWQPGQPKADKNITLQLNQTMIPVEVDELYSSVKKLSVSLGPQGANKDGALTNLVTTTAQNLAGNGEKLGNTFTQLTKAANTLDESRGNLVDTIKNLDSFVGMLRQNDDQVRTFNTQMASFNSFLAGERSQLGEALNKLSIALGDVATFVQDNRDALGDRVNELLPTTKTLADTKAKQKEILTLLPLVLNNLVNSYNAESGTLDLQLVIPELQNIPGAACKLLDLGKLKPGDPAFQQFSNTLRPLLDQCGNVAKQINNNVQTPLLNLPFGIMSNYYNNKRGGVPGTQPGTPAPDLQGAVPSGPAAPNNPSQGTGTN